MGTNYQGLKLFLDFTCKFNEDCHGHGVCNELGTCECQPGWETKPDCSGKKHINFKRKILNDPLSETETHFFPSLFLP